MRISDWSSDVCSSDLGLAILRRIAGLGGRRHHYPPVPALLASQPGQVGGIERSAKAALPVRAADADPGRRIRCLDRQSVVSGKSASVRVDLGGRRITKKQKSVTYINQQLNSSH